MPACVFLGVGSNLGDRYQNLKNAASALPAQIILERQSPVYETAPWGYLDQPAFLNQVWQVKTELEPGELLCELKTLETTLGRLENFHYGPRLIDLDILFYDSLILETESLTIPHPHLAQRAFVLVPLADLAPDFLHPVLQCSVACLLKKLDTRDVTWYVKGAHDEETL